jgi:hypothetical protein
MDDCERFIDAGCEPPTYELPLAEDTSPGKVRCGCCGGNSFERIGIGTVAFRIKVIVGFENEVLELQHPTRSLPAATSSRRRVCAGATYLLRDLCALDPVHPEQLAF